MEQTQIFISYRRGSEAAPVAVLLKDILTFRGYQVFLDTRDNLQAGSWRKPIEAAISTAADVIVLVSPGALERCREEDDVVRWEIETAFGRQDALGSMSMHIIPVFWDTDSFKSSSSHSVQAALPDTVMRLFSLNGVSFRGRMEDLPALYNDVFAKLCSQPGEIRQEVYDPPISTHRSDYRKEVKRLHLQERFSRELDAKLLKRALNAVGKKQGITAMDIGCADGYVTCQRLTEKRGFSKVIGIDRNAAVIEKARRENAGSVYTFEQVDVEKPDFCDRLREIMAETGVEAFDVIYSAFTLHHLNHPAALLEKLNDFLSPRGVILIRGVDDDAQLSYIYREDGTVDTSRMNLVRDITRLSIQTEGMSNRFHGRQLYAWLRQAGYTDIETEYQVIDTVGRDDDEREALYNYYFSFRTDYTERALEKDPGNAKKKRIHAELAARLASLKKTFLDDDDMYYMVLSFGAMARRHR